ncbi:MAG: von Willebrand factor type A domain-containing protein [Chloroflexota bacterium]|nr:von Willebrand factor type A domain-containing protein [Chloroflexota bacterium]MDE2962091.1 von Willebrand factor type A domain-containing protein [Chloroflexota bacterium]
MNPILTKAIVPLLMVLLLVVMACGGSAESPAPAAPAAAPQAAHSAPAATSAPAAAAQAAQPTAAIAAPAAAQPASASAQQQSAAMPASGPPQSEGFNNIGGTATVNDRPYDLTFFQHYGVNPFIDTEDDHLSTFAIDVDTASYTVARRFLDDGHLPDQNSIRVEEFVNYFDQGYEAPTDDAFAIHVDGSPSPFGNGNHWLMRVGLQGKELLDEQRQDATLVFTIDVSGSMDREGRLELVKQSLRLLVDELRSDDKVAIVTYGDRGSVLLEATEARERGKILQAIDSLRPGGSTYVEDGLKVAYRLAVDEVQSNRITRVMVLSDGVGNVGNTGHESILRQVQDYVDKGVTLTTIGFGMGNYNDILMEQLANDGDGAYYYVDTLSEARRIFVEDLTGTLQVIAKDAKVQVEFNPEVVSRYRLLGYENRDVADDDFRNDAVDAGEIGAGHSVTALYELKLREGADGTLGTVYMRYEDVGLNEVVEINQEFQRGDLAVSFEESAPRFQLSAVVAEFAEVLRGSYWAREGSLQAVADQARRVQQLLPESAAVVDFAGLTAQAARMETTADNR